MIRLAEARYVRDFVLWLRFTDGVEGEVDLRGELTGPVFEPLRDVPDVSFFSGASGSAH